MASRRFSARQKSLIVFLLALACFCIAVHANAQSAQDQYEPQLVSIEETLKQAHQAIDNERYEEGLASANKALQIAGQLPDTLAAALNARAVAQTIMGVAYAGAGDHAQAVEVWRKANDIYDRLTTTEANHALTLEYMAASLEVLGQHQEAIDAYWSAAFLAEKIGDYEKAVRPELGSLAILEKQLQTGASLSKLASGNYNVGLWDQKLGKCEEAALSFETSLKYLDKLTGSPDIGRVRELALQELGTCLTQMGQYGEWVKAAVVLHELSMYSSAEEYYEKGLALYEAKLPNGPERATFQQNIAFELSRAEDWWKAHEHLQAKLEILKQSRNTEKEQAATLRDDGLALENDSRNQEAYAAYHAALMLYTSLPGTQAQTAELLMRAGETLLALEKEREALTLYKMALPFYDQLKSDPGYDAYNHAVTLAQVGNLLAKAKQGSDAIPYYRQALAVSDNLRKEGDGSALRAKIRWCLGDQLQATGQVAEAVSNLSEGYFGYNREELLKLPTMSPKEREDFLYFVNSKARYLYRLAIQQPDPWLPLGVQAVVSAKSLTDEVSAAENRVWRGEFESSNPEELTDVNELRSAVARLVLLQVSEYGAQIDPKREQLKKSATELKTLEASLRRQVEQAWPTRALTIPRVADVRAALRDGDTILEYVTYAPDPDVLSETKGDERYGVFVLTAAEGRTFAIDLGKASAIDPLILAYRQLYESQIDPRKFHLDEDALAAQALKVKISILDPVLSALAKSEPATGKKRRFYIVPAGYISFVPFEALPQGQQGPPWHYMLEDYQFVYLETARDLVRTQRPLSNSNEVWLVGNPDFNAIPNRGDASSSNSAEKEYDDSIPKSWLELSGTGDLLQRIEQSARRLKLDPKVLAGRDASETSLRGLHSPKLLLLATHGYFMSDVAPVNSISLVMEGSRSPEMSADYSASMDPRMRSMLVFAGANRRYRPLEVPVAATKTGATRAAKEETQSTVRYDTDDGLLTAFEARDIDLRDTDVVVLVGCESGLGVVPRREYHNVGMDMSTGMGMRSEGGSLGTMVVTLPQTGDEAVTGLPLAFLVAGARSVISSTSTIPVGANAQLVDDFLEAWLNRNHGLNRYAAFHSAQLSALERARKKGSTHPFQWAGMIYIGQPDDAPNAP